MKERKKKKEPKRGRHEGLMTDKVVRNKEKERPRDRME
jgi:hypothetical protein